MVKYIFAAGLGMAMGLTVGSPADRLAAQEPDPVPDSLQVVEPAPPESLAQVEEARSRMCVDGVALLTDVDARLSPLEERQGRIEALHEAVTVEDRERVTPFDEDDPLEAAVREWFDQDRELAQRMADEPGDDLLEERRRLRTEMLERLEDEHARLEEEARELVQNTEGLEEALRRCQGAVFVRSTVLEACESTSSPLCDEARAEDPSGRFRFVENAVDLWDVEQLRPWSDPGPLRPTPTGGLGGATTSALTRRGNVTLAVGMEPIIQPRSSVEAEEVARFDANLDTLGIEFDHPAFVMAPALAVHLEIPGPLGGESHYLLHFAEVEDLEIDVLWAGVASDSGSVEGTFPANAHVLSRLAAGDELVLTAVRATEPEGAEPEGEPVFSLGITPVGQAQAVQTLLAYMADGGLSEDLRRLAPPDAVDGG